MKSLAIAAWAVALTAFATLSLSAEMPFNQAQFDATRAAGKPVAVVFHADWCPTCRAQAPVLKQLLESKELESVTLFVANFDTENALKRSLLGVFIVTGVDKSVEAWILDRTPNWLKTVTTKF
jgi:thiol-disulfide isomerase/thioredoxin